MFRVQRHLKKIVGYLSVSLLIVLTLGLTAGKINKSQNYIVELLEDNPIPFGYTSGSFQVSDNGASIYEVPIFVSPGTSGFSPNISLVYNSQAGNGLLGEGWILNGLSIISRTPSNIAQDGIVDGIDFDKNDRFTLDGQRLVSLNDEIYYQDSNEYRTEQESFKKIIVSGGGQPESFEVKSKDGLIYHYGTRKEANSRILFNDQKDKVLFWLVDKIEDRNGNYIKINYEAYHKESEFRPKEILYTGNSKTGMEPYNMVEFNYEDRQDTRFQYINGGKSTISKRLVNLKVYNSEFKYSSNKKLVRSYRFKYDTDPVNKKSYLKKIFECAGVGDKQECLDPITLSWSETSTEPFKGDKKFIRNNYNVSLNEKNEIFYGDLNKDGLPDKILIDCSKVITKITYLINNGKGKFNKPIVKSLSLTTFDNPSIFINDIDMDGDSDIIISWVQDNKLLGIIIEIGNDESGISFTKSKRSFEKKLDVSDQGDGFNIKDVKYQILIQDLNGDNLSDFILHYQHKDFFNYYTYYNEYNSEFVFGGYIRHPIGDIPKDQIAIITDLNGDEMKDIFYSWTSESGWFSQSFLNTLVKREDKFKVIKLSPNDYNIVEFSNEGYTKIEFENINVPENEEEEEGKISTIKESLSRDDFSKNNSIQLADINEDGNPDLLLSNTSENGWIVYLAQGLGNGRFDSPKKFILNDIKFEYNWNFITGEFNGDGVLDLLIYSTGAEGFQSYYSFGTANSRFEKSSRGLYMENIDFSYRVSENVEGIFCTDIRTGYNNNQWIQTALAEFDVDFGRRNRILNYPDNCSKIIDKMFALSPIETGYLPLSKRLPFFSKKLGSCRNNETPYQSDILKNENNIKMIKKVANHKLFMCSKEEFDNGAADCIKFPKQLYGEVFFEMFNFWKLNAVDINGDGISDLILDYPRHPKSAINSSHKNNLSDGLTDFTFLNETSKSGIVNQIAEGENSKVIINYKPLTDEEVYKMERKQKYPFFDVIAPLYVVNSTKSSNGIEGFNEVEYKYFNGISSIDGRGFLGFTKVSKRQVESNMTSITEYFTSESNLDMGISQNELLDKGIKLVKSKSRIYKDPKTGKVKVLETVSNVPILKKYGENEKYYFSYITKVKEEKFDLNTQERMSYLESDFNYDDYGNLSSLIVVHEDGLIERTDNEYDLSLRENWILGRLTESRISKSKGDIIASERITRFKYNKDNGQLVSEITNPNSKKNIIKTYEFDEFGNVIKSIVKGRVNKNDIQERIKITEYDNKGRFVTKSSDGLGYFTQKKYDFTNGNVVQEIDINGNNYFNKYDIFGNIKNSYDDLGNSKTFYSQKCNECPIPEASHFDVVVDSKSTPTITFYDKLSRVIKQQKFDFKERIINIDQNYDNLGKTISLSNPYFENDDFEFNQFYYDQIGRLVKKIRPSKLEDKYEYIGNLTIYTDPINRISKEFKNSRGLVLEKTEIGGIVTVFDYDLYNNPVLITENCSGSQIIQKFDENNNLIYHKSNDSKNDTSRDYNAFGELILEKNGANPTVKFSYDELGRMIEKNNSEGLTKWSYISSSDTSFGKGKLKELITSNKDLFNEKFEYDNYGKPISHTYTDKRFGKKYKFKSKYNDKGELIEFTYPTFNGEFSLLYSYDFGVLTKIYNSLTLVAYWELLDSNSRGQVLDYKYGNGLINSIDYKPLNNLISNISVNSSSNLFDSISYEYDIANNVIRTENKKLELYEEFEYDDRDRLVMSKTKDYEVNLEYDCIGRILSKSDIGDYTYGNKFELISAGNHMFKYDKRGNRLNGIGNYSLKYNSQNKPRIIFDNQIASKIYYGSNNKRQRITTTKKSKILGKQIEQTIYLGGLIERTMFKPRFGKYKFQFERLYIYNNGAPFAYIDRKITDSNNTVNEELFYTHKDLHGNTTLTTDSSAKIKRRTSYDSWGSKRCSKTWLPYEKIIPEIEELCVYKKPALLNNFLSIGYQNHNYVKWTNLIDMGGRYYDPQLGSFNSLDSYVDLRLSNQGMNPYAYVLNNPLKYNDPSGYFIGDLIGGVLGAASDVLGGFVGGVKGFLDDNIVTIVVVGAGIASGYGAVAMFSASGGLGGAVAFSAGFGFGSAFSGSMMSGVSFSDSLQAGFSSAAISATAAAFTYGIGTAFTPKYGQMTTSQYIGKAVTHGAVQGVFRASQGGKFEHGFLAGSFSSLAGPLTNNIDASNDYSFGRIVTAASIGGTASVIGGGKFANGAISGAMVQAFNEDSHRKTHYPSKLIESKIYSSYGNFAQASLDGNVGVSLYFGVGGGVFYNTLTEDLTLQLGYGLGSPGLLGVSSGLSWSSSSSVGMYTTGTFMGVNGNMETNFHYNNTAENYNYFTRSFESWIGNLYGIQY